MMNRHPETRLALDTVRRWRTARDGRLSVHGAAVWITRDGDLDDHVLQPGEDLRVRAGEQLTLEPWRHGTLASLRFEATPAPIARWQRQLWQTVARLAGWLGTRLLGLARGAETLAGCPAHHAG
jgi:hypothetical protein